MFTFKKHPKVGRYGSFDKDYTDIKHNKKIVGNIQETNGNRYRVGWMVIKDESMPEINCKWEWAFWRGLFPDEKTAREFIKDNSKEILKTYNLYHLEE